MTQPITPEVVIFTDLDDSLFQTRRKCPEDGLSPAAYNIHGEPLSFHTPQQRALLKLFRGATLIPVTGRSSAALKRARSLSWNSYRVASHGALILDPDEQPLKSWRDVITKEISQEYAQLELAHEMVQGWVERWATRHHDQHQLDPIRVKMTYEADLPVYLSIKGPQVALTGLKEELSELWSSRVIHHNDRNMALLPSYSSKSRAVSHLREVLTSIHSNEPLFIGLGDSVSDLPFLKQCHFAITPQQSQIHQELWR